MNFDNYKGSRNTFWNEICTALNIPLSHPKRQKMQDYAWELGHSNGLNAVYNALSEIWEIVKD